MSKAKIIVNPQAGHGYAAKMTPQIRQHLHELGVEFDLVHTKAVGEAASLAQQALTEGYEPIVAVGGDGTSQEVVNGLMQGAAGNLAGTLAWIPTGSGNDFALMNGVPEDIEGACRLIAEGATRTVDVGHLTVDGHLERYFDNVVGIGFDALALKETKKFKRLRGMALYLPAVLKTIFLTLKPTRMEITCDGQTISMTPLMVAVANGVREGGGFLITPQARCDDGLLDVMIAEWMPRLQMLAMVPRFLKGTHVNDPRVSVRKARHITIASEDPLYFHADGEILCDVAHHIEIIVIPHCLRVVCPQDYA